MVVSDSPRGGGVAGEVAAGAQGGEARGAAQATTRIAGPSATGRSSRRAIPAVATTQPGSTPAAPLADAAMTAVRPMRPAAAPPGGAPQGFAGGAPQGFAGGAPSGFAGNTAPLAYGAPATVTPESLDATGARPSSGRPSRNYPIDSTSPLWWLLASIGIGLVAFSISVLGVFAASSSDSTEDALAVFSGSGLLGSFIMLFAYVCVFVWIYTIGKNGGTYGIGLVLLVAFPIYLIPFVLLGAGGVLFAVLVYFCWPYRLFVTGVWKAGRLPPVWALLGWVPPAMATALFLGAVIAYSNTSTQTGSGAALGIVVAAQLLWLISWVFNLISLLSVTLIQHLKIREDRRIAQSWPGAAV